MPINYPERNEHRAAFRRVVEMLCQATPITAALAHLYGYTHPGQFEQDLERFRREIALTVNGHEERLARLEAVLAPRATISALAVDVAFYILRANDSGHSDPVVFESLCEAFPDTERASIEEAAAELSHQDYATTSAAIGYAIRTIRPTNAMFLAFDLVATGRDTRADALVIARLWLEDESALNVFQLCEQLGWEPRRLNPALSALRPVFRNGRWSRECHPTLVTTSVLVTADERFMLRRMLESGRVDWTHEGPLGS